MFGVHLPLIGVKNLLLPDIADSAVLHRWVASSLTLLAMTTGDLHLPQEPREAQQFFSM